MTKKFLIRKASGEIEPFLAEKLKGSLIKVGTDHKTADLIIAEVYDWLQEGVSTKKIYKEAFRLLKKYKAGPAARYRLKKALMEMGPSGYPFEHFVSQLIKHYGYEVKVGEIVQGKCVKHEVDVLATKDNEQVFVECKYYNSQGKNANVRVPLYIRSRVDDIINYRKELPENKNTSFSGWIYTNTRFTTDAIDFGKCSGLKLISWDYPKGSSLKEMIEEQSFFPLTALTSLNRTEKQVLMEEGIVLCRQLCNNDDVIEKLNLSEGRIKKLKEEVSAVCSCL